MVNMRSEAQRAIATHLRSAIWNWIGLFPAEYNDAIRTRGRMEGAPERIFDLLYSMIPPGGEKIFWPSMAILHCTTADRIDPNYNYNTGAHKGKKVIVDHHLYWHYYRFFYYRGTDRYPLGT